MSNPFLAKCPTRPDVCLRCLPIYPPPVIVFSYKTRNSHIINAVIVEHPPGSICRETQQVSNRRCLSSMRYYDIEQGQLVSFCLPTCPDMYYTYL